MKAVHNAKKGWFISSNKIKLGDQHFRAGNLYEIIEIQKNGVIVIDEQGKRSLIIFTLPCEHLQPGHEWDLYNRNRVFHPTFPKENEKTTHTPFRKENTKGNRPSIESKKITVTIKNWEQVAENKTINPNKARKKIAKETLENAWGKYFKKKAKALEEKLQDKTIIIENLLAENGSLVADIENYENKLDESYKEQEVLAAHAQAVITGFSNNIQIVLSNTGVLLKEDIKYFESLAKRAFVHQTKPILDPSSCTENE